MVSIFKKEIIEAIRSYRFLVILFGIALFALLDPIMLKLLPKIMQSQFEGLDISQLISLNQPNAALNYYKNLQQIGSIIICFALMKIIAGELKEKTAIIPYCNSLSFSKMVFAKFTVYTLYLLSAVVLSSIINYLYASTLFSGERFSFIASVKSGVLFGLYFSFLATCLMFFGALFKKPNVAALCSVVIALFTPALGSLFKVASYLPSGLLDEAQLLIPYLTTSGLSSLIVTIGLSFSLLFLTIFRLKTIDLS
ncbi:hypothetical protein IMX26_08950 [Clostridium sp. 'deep sea']|uniref:hypothetical protein n=1 Tax=Clostridium sp. 'deep sea' TaxID=2779445 RepID=UPI0018965312|nr:hypothetical protein [Clostridium sp. 'deep sea']QOR33635.1 hypothetical protein IMX26_08950 [Clostridium sp. 'deep sea']